MSANKSKNELRRYMPATAMLDMLLNNHLVLLDPKSWDDRNDSHFMEAYRQREGIKSIRAACFSAKAETYHHWKVFAPGESGVCAVFNREPFVRWVDEASWLRGGYVRYLTIERLKKLGQIPQADIPFLKRKPYEDECEYRVVFEDRLFESTEPQKFELPTSMINRIICSPWMPRDVYLSLKTIVQKLPMWSDLSMTRSTLVETEMWKDAIAVLPDELPSR